VSLADAFADMYPGHEDDARQAAVAVDATIAAGDVLYDGLRNIVRGGRALLRATWALNKACWRLRKAVTWADLLRETA
jgi:hypothetical protein